MSEPARPGLAEVLVVWGLFLAVALTIVATYARLDPALTYRVDESGLAGGLGRALVFLGYPTSLAAVAALAVAVDRLGSRLAVAAGLASLGLCLTVVVPGVVDESDLDARPVNALAAAGVAIALGLTLRSLARDGSGGWAPFGRWDVARLALAVVLLLASLPWLAAELGFHVPGALFLSEEIVPEPGDPDLAAVHLGHHHGLDGVLLAWTALLLSRVVGRVRRRALRAALGLYLALMLVYGLANALQDFWLEQLVKRGATEHELPSLLRPSLSAAWLAIVGAALVVYVLAFAAGRVNRLPRRVI